MTAADRTPTPLNGVGVLVPVRLCALLAEELRTSRVDALQPVRDAALEVAADNTARRQRSSGTGTSLTADQAAEMLHVSPGFVRRLLRSGELEGEKDAGTWRIPQSAAERRARDGKRTGAGGGACTAPR
jgi:excisionase family DNA binding protein